MMSTRCCRTCRSPAQPLMPRSASAHPARGRASLTDGPANSCTPIDCDPRRLILRQEDADAIANPTRRSDGTLTPPTLPHASKIGSAQPEVCCSHPIHTASTPPDEPTLVTAVRFGPSQPPSAPATPFNPHTSTALTATCKSPYPTLLRSGSIGPREFCSRSTVDTRTRDLLLIENRNRAKLSWMK